MHILIGYDIKPIRFIIKSYIHEFWPDAVVYEESNLDSVIADVFDQHYDLLLLDVNIPGSENIEAFIEQAVKYTKVIVFSESEDEKSKLKWINQLGADAFLGKSAGRDDIITTLMFVLNEV